MRKIFFLALFTYSALHIQAQNNVGIGTITPETKLQVTDSTNAAAIKINTIYGPLAGLELNASEDVTTNYFRLLKETNNGASQNRTIFNNGPDAGSFIFSHGSTERMRIDNNGRVGIGTDSPDVDLDISNTGNVEAKLESINGSFANLKLKAGSTANNYFQIIKEDDISESNVTRIENAADAGGMTIGNIGNQNVNFKTNNVNRVSILGNGKVGIGTTTPNEKLHINGNLKVDSTIIANKSGGTQGQVLMSNGNGTMQWAAMNTNSGGGAGAGPWENWCTDNVSEYFPISDINGEIYDSLGSSVSISGDFAIAGIPYDNEAATGAGSVSVYKFNSILGEWLDYEKLLNPSPQANDHFGKCVSIHGDFAIVGAPNDDEGYTDNGSATIFKRNSITGIWENQGKLLNINPQDGDLFGSSVSIFDNYAIVGAPNDDEGYIDNGSAVIFERNINTGIWTSVGKILNANHQNGDRFGNCVDIKGDYSIIGAYLDDEGGFIDNGSATIFKRNTATGIWESQGKVHYIFGSNNDQFGFGVSISYPYILIGERNGDTDDSGRALLYRFSTVSGFWEYNALLAVGSSNDGVGYSVNIDGEFAIVGTPFHTTSNYGRSKLYRRFGNQWKLIQQFAIPTPFFGEIFGFSVCIDKHNRRFIVGAPGTQSGRGMAFFGKVK